MDRYVIRLQHPYWDRRWKRGKKIYNENQCARFQHESVVFDQVVPVYFGMPLIRYVVLSIRYVIEGRTWTLIYSLECVNNSNVKHKHWPLNCILSFQRIEYSRKKIFILFHVKFRRLRKSLSNRDKTKQNTQTNTQ